MSDPLYFTPEDPTWAQRLKDDPEFAAVVDAMAQALDAAEGMTDAEREALFPPKEE
jgi:hypothetical protein